MTNNNVAFMICTIVVFNGIMLYIAHAFPRCYPLNEDKIICIY